MSAKISAKDDGVWLQRVAFVPATTASVWLQRVALVPATTARHTRTQYPPVPEHSHAHHPPSAATCSVVTYRYVGN